MATNLQCCLKSCDLGNLTSDMSRVEVKSFEVPSSERMEMHANWAEDGEGKFHHNCWKKCVRSVKKDEPFKLREREKDMIREARKTAEYFDSKAKVAVEASRIAQMLKSAKYAIAFTGAGISTSAGIGDFRGKSGKWTENDRAKAHGPAKHKRRERGFTYESLRPTYTHEALCKLLEMGYLKHLISQNCDGIHSLSGIPKEKLSEMHGNSFTEKCESCGARYDRPFSVSRDARSLKMKHDSTIQPLPCPTCRINHRTGRRCERPGCNGCLMNTIINFGDSLEDPVITKAFDEGKKNDLVLCLGSSLSVTPACDVVTMGTDPPRLAICNRQSTQYDELCTVEVAGQGHVGSRVFADCDQVMSEVMRCLLPAKELAAWEGASEDRHKQYDSRRINY